MKKILSIFLGAVLMVAFIPVPLVAASFMASTWTQPFSQIITTAGPQAIKADYFENIVTTFDLNITKYLPKLYKRYGNQGVDVLDMLMALGFERTDSVTIINHFEENWIHQAFKVKAHAAGAAGAPVNITLSADSLDANNRYYPRISDTVTFPNEVGSYLSAIDVSTPSAPIITLIPFDVTKNIPAVTEGQVIIITGNSFSEGSTQPAGRFSGAWKYTNHTQIVKESVGASGTQMTNESWVKMADNKSIEGWFNKGLLDKEFRMKTNIQGVFLSQEKNTNPLVVDTLNSNATINTTEGLFPYMKRVAIPYPYTPGTLTVQDFNSMVRLMTKQFTARTVCAMLGQDVDLEMEDVLKEYFQFTTVGYTTEVVNNKYFGDTPEGKALAASIAFSALGKGGFNFAFKAFESMSNPQTYGADGFKYPGKAVFFPLESKKDPKSKNDIPAIGVVWKGMGSYNRKMEMFDMGGAGNGIKTTPVDRRDWYLRSEVSTEFMGGNQFIDMFVQ